MPSRSDAVGSARTPAVALGIKRAGGPVEALSLAYKVAKEIKKVYNLELDASPAVMTPPAMTASGLKRAVQQGKELRDAIRKPQSKKIACP